jgi:protein TonB
MTPLMAGLLAIARVRGKVVMEAVVGTDGQVASLHVLSGHPFLINSAMDAAKKYRYVPAVCGGEPVELLTSITVEFKTEIDPLHPIP